MRAIESWPIEERLALARAIIETRLAPNAWRFRNPSALDLGRALRDRVKRAAATIWRRSGADYEDNVQSACAQAAGPDLIVTRDTTSFTHAGMPAISPPDIARDLPRPRAIGPLATCHFSAVQAHNPPAFAASMGCYINLSDIAARDAVSHLRNLCDHAIPRNHLWRIAPI